MAALGCNFSKTIPLMGKSLMEYNSIQNRTVFSRPPFPPRPAPGRKDCGEVPPPRCSKEAIAKLDKCELPKLPPLLDPKCCQSECMHAFPRFDELYKTTTDKLTRKYQQTWCECPHIYIYPREVCCYERHEYEPMERRIYPKRPGGQVDKAILLMLMCRNKSATKCSKVVWPGCRKVRDPPRCSITPKEPDCPKKCTPFPAFSECLRDPPRPLRPVECQCLRLPAVCVSHLL